jgi:hypothetical protein
MPFDGVGFSANEYSQKIDALIDLIGTPENGGKELFVAKMADIVCEVQLEN